MKVKELIERLQQCDPDDRVGAQSMDGDEPIAFEIENVNVERTGRIRVILEIDQF